MTTVGRWRSSRIGRRVVVAHRGARDQYQVARALDEAQLLEALVTDLYWPADKGWASRVDAVTPTSIREMLASRTETELTSAAVRSCFISGGYSIALSRAKHAPFAWQRAALRWSDHVIGRRAGRLARDRNAALLAYSYYGHSAFATCGNEIPKILFQLHPHPVSVRGILLEELRKHPDCKSALSKEWELCLPESDFARLAGETRMADHWIAASSFTRETLVEHGVPRERIQVVPYGVNANRFRIGTSTPHGKLRLLFVGRLNQRKGIKYLSQAMSLLNSRAVELTVCGWAAEGLDLLQDCRDRVKVIPSASADELAKAYASADLFVLPSIAEGFGHVLLEALASGIPIVATTRTAAPDLIEEGREGFLVEPSQPEQIAERIEWAVRNRAELERMKRAARETAERFTWERFRRGLQEAVGDMLADRHGVTEVQARAGI